MQYLTKKEAAKFMSEFIDGISKNDESLEMHEKLAFILGHLQGVPCTHFCPDWDFACIDQTMQMFDSCTCSFKKGERLCK